MTVQRVAARTIPFTESVIREMTRLIGETHPHDGINLAQGFPDFPAPSAVKEAACDAIRADINQYAITWGAKSFRDAIAAKTATFLGLDVDPETEITVTCGATEGMVASMLATVNPGDEVVIFEPFYENYGPDCILAGAVPRFVPLQAPAWTFDPDQLAAAFSDRTRAVVINSPNNPTGKIFTRSELEMIGRLCERYDCVVFSDEIYEHLTYDGEEFVSPAVVDGLRGRTAIINGLSKTYSVTGWRVGYIIAPPDLTTAIRKVHDFLTVGAAAPLQEAGTVALNLPASYFDQLRRGYEERRDLMLQGLRDSGFVPFVPRGAYYIMSDIASFGFPDDVTFAHALTAQLGVAVVPGSSFYSDPVRGRTQVRFAFPKRLETLRDAIARLHATGATLILPN
ncbi:MAG TPA: aminotransferase class I/II-fold pyridoxal phosphate-dependent enzyme [Chloroflexota bacterium]|nr:aminotransferase class I/II-fold pyridoxal phosphate-dependent enzyme [Chloroflexota bacterium]